MIEEKTCPYCGEPYEGRLTEHLVKTCKPVEVKMEELIRLTNSRVRELETRLAESAGREQSLMLQLGARDKRLAKVEHQIKIKDLELGTCRKACSEQSDKLRSASELIEKWRKGTPLKTTISYREGKMDCADELEAILRGKLMKCKYYEEDIYDGVIAQVFCVHPDVVKPKFECPFGNEVECDLNAHLRNLKEIKKNE